MVKILFLCILLTTPPSSHSLLEELAAKSTSLSPIMKVIDLYVESGIVNYIPVRPPVFNYRRISSPYGYRNDPFTGKKKFHTGIDYACDLAATVHTTASGTVIYVGYRSGYGKCIEVKHKYGFSTIYAHLSDYYVAKGTKVRVGKVIGFVGSTGRSTGNHLHYEVRKNNQVIKPLFL